MHGSWLLFFFMAHAGNLIKVLDGSLQGWADQDTPTCEELREFWNSASRSMKMSESTNEIPLLPLDVFSFSEEHRQKGRKKPFTSRHYSPGNSIQHAVFEDRLPSFPKERLSSTRQDSNSLYMKHPDPNADQQLYGIFGRYAEEEEPSPVFGQWSNPANVLSGTKKKGGSEMIHAPSWGVPEEVGMFGRFLDFEEGLPLNRRYATSLNSQGTGNEHRRGQDLVNTKEPCNRVANKHCTVDEDCECSGWNSLRCQHGKCYSHSLNKGQDNEFGYWHEAALPSSKLGLFKRSQRSIKSIYM